MSLPQTDWEALEQAHGSGAYGSRGLTIVRGRGATVYDKDGRAYIDCTAMYGVASLGHAHPALVQAIREQGERLMVCFGSFANDRRAALFTELAALLAPCGRFFLCNSGTEAVEAALKLARLTTGRAKVVAAMQGFHGRTMGALSATHKPDYRLPFEPLVPGFEHVAYNDVAALERAVTPEVGAVILEPVQGEGGVRPAEPAFVQAAAQLCRERGAMFIVDEVQTGFGRTGRWFGYQHYDVEPDLVCLAKGMAGGFPMGAVALGPRVARLAQGQHGSTFGGNPLACAAALAVIRVMREESLPERAAELGAVLLDRLRTLVGKRVREVRGVGLMIGIELRERALAFQKVLQDRGVLVLGAGPTVLRLLPPLVIERQEIDEAAEVLLEVLA
ncbi:MAG: acetylornithine/succinylornithine family transaminase [Planctomycetota bacterium]